MFSDFSADFQTFEKMRLPDQALASRNGMWSLTTGGGPPEETRLWRRLFVIIKRLSTAIGLALWWLDTENLVTSFSKIWKGHLPNKFYIAQIHKI